MKKIYTLALSAFLVSVTANAQFNDDFESYTLGNMADQNPTVWSNWSGDPVGAATENIEIVDFYAQSGFQSGSIGAGPGPQDAVMNLGNKTTGEYRLDWYMYIPGTKTGYFNIQGQLTPTGGADAGAGIFNSGNLGFNTDGLEPGVYTDATTGESGTYPADDWFLVSIDVDMAGPTFAVSIDGTLVNATPVPFAGDTTLGGIDFYAVDANNEYYVDTILYVDLLSTDDFAQKGFSAYPNPVNNVLNLNAKEAISSVSIYNVLGQEIYTANVDALTTSIDTSSFASGAYFVKVNIAGTEGTVKILK